MQFVGFMAAYRQPGLLDPIVAGTLGGIFAMWCTFVPSFLWIFLGAPYMEAVAGNKALNTALSAITAAVVGVILNLAVWFSLNSIFRDVTAVAYGPVVLQVPDAGTVELPALALSALAVVAIFVLKLGMIRTLALCAALGAAFSLVTDTGSLASTV